MAVPQPAVKAWEVLTFPRDRVLVRSVTRWDDEARTLVLLAAEVSLPRRPGVRAGLLVVPEAERRLAEESIGVVSDTVSVGTGVRRGLISAERAVTFRGEGADLVWLKRHPDVYGASVGLPQPRYQPRVPVELIAKLYDREDGIAIRSAAERRSGQRVCVPSRAAVRSVKCPTRQFLVSSRS